MLTKDGKYKLRFDGQWKSNGLWGYVEYNTFIVDGECNDYTLHVGGFGGGTGYNSFFLESVTDGMKFSTYDRDNDLSTDNCAATYGGGFWYNNCGCVLINSFDNNFKFYCLGQVLMASRFTLIPI
jgi:hypothetical protein